MESHYNTPKNQWNSTPYPPIKFKKFQMKLEETGVHILISANFLKKGNHSVRVHQGVLFLKIGTPEGDYGHHGTYKSFKGLEKEREFRFSLPYKKHRYIQSVRFDNTDLKIHLTDKKRAGCGMTFPQASPHPNGTIA